MVQILGDIHGNFQKLYMKAMTAKDTTIIQVGDFGVGFRSRERMDVEMIDINKRLEKNNIISRVELIGAVLYLDARPEKGVHYTIEIPISDAASKNQNSHC